MLGVRTALKTDLGCSSAEMVYGTTLCVPGVVFTSSSTTQLPDPTNYVQYLQSFMNNLQPVPPRVNYHSQSQRDSNLSTSTQVFVRQDGVKKSLQQPYKGPFKVSSRTTKHFTVDVHGRQDTIYVIVLNQQPYKGPCKVSSRTTKHFTVDVHGRQDTI